MAFRSSLEPCTFSRYRCPSKQNKSCLLVFNANTSGDSYLHSLHRLALCLDRLTRACCLLSHNGAMADRVGPSLLNDARTCNSCYTLDLHGLLNQFSHRQHYRKLFNDSTLLYRKRAKRLASFPAFKVTHSVPGSRDGGTHEVLTCSTTKAASTSVNYMESR